MKYIDADKLIAEIERQQRRLAVLSLKGTVDVRRDCALQNGIYAYILDLVTTLQQEQPEVDLEKEIHRFFEECIEVHDVPLYGKVKERVIRADCYEITAYHFYKLGQRTKYQQDRAEFAKLKAKEWQSGYDEGYAKGLNAEKERNKI